LIYADADSLAAAFFAGREALESVRALDLRLMQAELCALCGGGPSTRMIGRYVRSKVDPSQRLAEWHEVCASCGKPWAPEPWGERCVLRGEIQVTPRTDAVEDALHHRLERWRKLRAVVEPRPRAWGIHEWINTLALWRGWLHPSGGSYEVVSAAARERGNEISADQLGRLLRGARGVVHQRGQRGGLIPSGSGQRQARTVQADPGSSR
jgi:hypothetical protein